MRPINTYCHNFSREYQ